jgi:MoxR-like ATPase
MPASTKLVTAEMNEKILEQSAFTDGLRTELHKAIIGQEKMIERLLIALLANGHVLLEGLPGLAKTRAIKSLAQAIHAKFNRIQFTPDLLPADLLGTNVFNYAKNEFSVKKGPVFANFILADEINRSSAKLQSALLQAMEEHQITIGDQTFSLDDLFMVLATQNPIEQEGTYPLPEAQSDRFMMKVLIHYPTQEEERLIMQLNVEERLPELEPVVSIDHILKARKVVRGIYADEKIEQYILNIVFATRSPDEFKLNKMKNMLRYGSSPRGSIYLLLASKALAFLNHRAFVIPEDVRAVYYDVMRHRIGLSYEAEAENLTADDVLREIIDHIIVP